MRFAYRVRRTILADPPMLPRTRITAARQPDPRGRPAGGTDYRGERTASLKGDDRWQTRGRPAGRTNYRRANRTWAVSDGWVLRAISRSVLVFSRALPCVRSGDQISERKYVSPYFLNTRRPSLRA